MNRPIKVAIAGCGGRGWETYAQTIAKKLPELMEVVAAADPREDHLELMRDTCPTLRKEQCFHSVQDMLDQGKLADALFVCTPDRDHYATAVAGLNLGYHILLEKPIAPTAAECREVERLALEKNLHVVVCHVLRYTPFFDQLKQLLDSHVIGKLMAIRHTENVSYWHQAHSFVRGNWGNSDKTTPMILQKCCHDTDILLWLTGKHALRVSSFGHLSHFTAENAPAGAPERCTDPCPAADECPYNAVRFYMNHVRNGKTNWPISMLCAHVNEENVMESLKNGPYGRCVYRCDNNVVDHQIINIEMEDELEISFMMCGFTSNAGRTIRLMGTRGEIVGDIQKELIRIIPFGGEPQDIDVSKLTTDFSGHAGGDVRMLREFAQLLETGEASIHLSSISDSVESHIIALAAEESRLADGKLIELR